MLILQETTDLKIIVFINRSNAVFFNIGRVKSLHAKDITNTKISMNIINETTPPP